MRGAVSIALAYKQVFPLFLMVYQTYSISVLVIISSASLSVDAVHSFGSYMGAGECNYGVNHNYCGAFQYNSKSN